MLAAGAPDVAPFMADEVLWSMPDIEGIDYTMKEYLKLVEKTRECVERLNSEGRYLVIHCSRSIVCLLARSDLHRLLHPSAYIQRLILRG